MARPDSSYTAHTAAKPGKSVSTAALTLGLAVPALAAGGALLANKGITSPFGGFLMFGSALPVAVLVVLLGLASLFRGRGGRNPAAVRKGAIGMTAAFLTVAAVLGLAAPGGSYPRINDITTDTEDPPDFVANVKLQRHPGEPMAYNPAFAALQKQAYPTISSRVVALPPEQAFERVRDALENLHNVKITYASVKEGRIEAVAVSRVFRFADDVVVRIRPVAEGSRIDVRSRSRVGQGDMGVNAQRIENVLATLH